MSDRPVFLSASLPDPRRNPQYYGTADLTAIREATRALATVVLPRTRLVFGGHPAITPLVRAIAQRLGRGARVRIFQSAFFAGQFPSDNSAFPDIVITPAVGNDRVASLRVMRERMINEFDYHAGIFIGGMEGVVEEYELFDTIHSGALRLPVASTGGAAAIVFSRLAGTMSAAQSHDLQNDLAYAPLFRRTLGYP